MSSDEALDIVYSVVREFNRQMSDVEQLPQDPETRLVGDGGRLDSLGLVNFLVMLEDSVETRLGQHIILLDEDHMIDSQGPLRNLGAVAEHVVSQISAPGRD